MQLGRESQNGVSVPLICCLNRLVRVFPTNNIAGADDCAQRPAPDNSRNNTINGSLFILMRRTSGYFSIGYLFGASQASLMVPSNSTRYDAPRRLSYQLRAIDISRIRKKQGKLESQYINPIREALFIIFDL